MTKQWEEAQEWEKDWWGDCLNTYGEEQKQIVYAEKMGLKWFHNGKSPYNIDVKGSKIIDVGGGVCSLLLKCVNRAGRCVVADPILEKAPKWVNVRYLSSDIVPSVVGGEKLTKNNTGEFDEVWIYNCLQHTIDPKLIIDNAKKIGKVIRIFEWIDTHTNIGHPHSLTEENLNKWLGGTGAVESLNQPSLKGKCYYGIFKGDNYAK